MIGRNVSSNPSAACMPNNKFCLSGDTRTVIGFSIPISQIISRADLSDAVAVSDLTFHQGN